MRQAAGRRVAVVIGSDELGSAVAVALHAAGFAVVLCDEVDPVGIRRGMSFTDAWYVGSATLEGVRATFCASVRSVPTVLAGGRMIAATTWSWRGVAAGLSPVAIVDARCGARGQPADLVTGVQRNVLTIGATPWYVPGENACVTLWPAQGTRVAAGEAWDPLAAEPERRLVVSGMGGRFQTARRIGDRMQAGDLVGVVGVTAMNAPVRGVLSGLVARGSRIEPGARVFELDTRGRAELCAGTPVWCAGIAGNVVGLVQAHAAAPSQLDQPALA